MARSQKAHAHRWLRRLFILSLTLLLLAGIGVAILAYLFQKYVVEDRSPELDEQALMQRISEESPVYYRDGTHKIGVFFGAEHRQYIKYDALPEDYVHAIISSEDARFFEHRGIDPQGIARAMVANLKARQVVAGGSTITQQTIKNLFYRNERTWQAKLHELLLALRLEQRYSKEKILEFYANQFHVYSNGRGLGIAARYFFDKEVKDLSRLECAFLAGVVKGPFRYNPFVGATDEARARSRTRAKFRTHYVLNRMAINGYLNADELEELRSQELQFKEGDFRYDHNVILDQVYAVLQNEPFTSLFQQHKIDDPATAGISIVTTVDREFQQAAEYGLRHNLSEVGALLEGVTLEDFLAPKRRLNPIGAQEIHPFAFLPGRVKASITSGVDAPGLAIDLGGITGIVTPDGIQRVADLLKQAEGKNRRTFASKKDRIALAREFPIDRDVWVSVRRLRSDGTPELDLEANTELQGAMVMLEQGQIRAIVGGQHNRNFNRATSALRQLGSTFKPLTFAAALTLGWGALSPLDNRRQGFPFQGQWYWPRPDHEGVQPYVSLAFSGASSENVTAVSLLYHLTDLLSEDQLIDLADRVGMAPLPNEAPDEFVTRIRDTYGILPTDASLEDGLYEALKSELKVDLAFAGKPQEATELTWLPFGTGFDAERMLTEKARLPAEEKAVRLRYLSRHFRALESLAPQALAAAEVLLRGARVAERPGGVAGFVQQALGMSPGGNTPPTEAQADPAELATALEKFYVAESGGNVRLIFSEMPERDWRPTTLPEVRMLLTTGSTVGLTAHPPSIPGVRDEALEARVRTLPESASGLSAPPGPEFEPSLPPVVASRKPEDVIQLEGLLSPSTVRTLREALDLKLNEAGTWEKFSLRRLAHHREFRVMVGLQYVIKLARAMGVRSSLKPVLSLTLGANEITLLEAAMMYQTFLEGRAYSTLGEGKEADAALVAEIRDPKGQVIYRAQAQVQPVLDPRVGTSVGRILRLVVEQGTGARAARAVRLASVDQELDRNLARKSFFVPVMGKTGTTNDYLNVAFIGFLPMPEPPQVPMPFAQALTVAAYVGYDDNRPMKRGAIRVQGSNGALPAWLDAAQGVTQDLELGRKLPLLELVPGQVLGLAWPTEFLPVLVDKSTGLRSGSGLLEAEQPVPDGALLYEVAGAASGVGFREREVYQPFVPWGDRSEQLPEHAGGSVATGSDSPTGGLPAGDRGAAPSDPTPPLRPAGSSPPRSTRSSRERP